MTYANAQFKNSGNDEGDILNFFNNQLRNLVQKNGGDNTFSMVSEYCHDKDATVQENVKTKLRLTHSGHAISQFEKGFISVEANLDLKMNSTIQDDSYDDGHENLNVIFVGFKDAVEIISDLQFWVDGRLVDGYNQSEMIKESFAYNSIRSKDAKTGYPNSHSLWESVSCMSPNVAGVFIPLKNFEDDNTVHVKMFLTIPYTDQLALQAWRLYPNRILGEMEEEIKFSHYGLVWCQLQPNKVQEIMKFWNDDAKVYINAPFVPITNHFTQIGQEAIIVKSAKNSINDTPTNLIYNSEIYDGNEGAVTCAHYELMTNALECKKLEIEKCYTNCAGFGIKPDVMQGLMDGLHEPIIIPSQELSKYQFEHVVTDSRVEMSKSIPLCNATNITIMFPSSPNDYTVFKNVMLERIKLIVNKKPFPETEFDNTYDGRFVQYELMANELDGLEPTQEFLESISRPLNWISPLNPTSDDDKHGLRLFCSPFDNTSFGINFQLERGNSGYVFDGIDTGSHAVTIEFRASHKFKEAEQNSYLYPKFKVNGVGLEIADKIKPANPEMWVCSDTYWTWSIEDGVRYYHRGIPAGYD